MSEVAALRDLVELRGEKSAGAKHPQLPYIGLEHVAQNSGEIIGRPPSASSVSINSVFASGDILFGKLRPNLRKCAQATFAGYCSTDLLVFRAKSGTDPSFAARTLQSETVFGEAIRTAEGTKMPRTSWSALEGLPVFHPPLRQQRAIAKVLDTVDAAIRSTVTLIAKLEQMKQGLLHELLTQGIRETGEVRDLLRYPEQFTDAAVGILPAKWTQSSLGECCTIHDRSRFPIASEIRASIRGPFPYYGPTGVLDFIDEFRFDGTYFLIGEDGDHFLKWAKRPMTQLVSGKFNVNNHAHVLQGTTNCLTEWAALFFRHRDITLSLTRQGAGRFKLNQAALRNLWVPLPPIPEQRQILGVLNAFEQDVSAHQTDLRILGLLQRGLMDDLLTGRVRVTVDDEEAK